MSRPDVVTVKDDGQKFKPHPEGQYPASCVDVIHCGEVVKSYPGSADYVAEEVAVVFWTGERNDEVDAMHEATARMTISMGRKANLRKFLEDWRGKSYSDDEAMAGVPLHKLVGHNALISVEQKKSGAGRVYATIKSIAPLPKGLQVPELPDYERPKFWEERKKSNAAAVAAWKAENSRATAPVTTESFDDFPEALDAEDDDLPF